MRRPCPPDRLSRRVDRIRFGESENMRVLLAHLYEDRRLWKVLAWFAVPCLLVMAALRGVYLVTGFALGDHWIWEELSILVFALPVALAGILLLRVWNSLVGIYVVAPITDWLTRQVLGPWRQ